METLLTPEQKLRNVASIVKRYATPNRLQNGRGKMPSYPVDKHTIASSALQLAEMIEQYLDSKLMPDKVDIEIPF